MEFEPDSISAAAAAVVAASHKRSHEEPIVTPDEHGAYGYAHLPFVFPVVLDANALRGELLYVARKGRTVLVNAANSGVLRPFCARHVMDEVDEYLPKWAREADLTPEAVRDVWARSFLPLLRCVDVPQGLAVGVERERLDALATPGGPGSDPDDVPTATLALLLGSPLLSMDQDPLVAVYGPEIDYHAHGSWLKQLRSGGDLGPIGGFLRSVEMAGSLVGRGLYAGARGLVAKVPWPWLLLGGATTVAAAHALVPAETQRNVGKALGTGVLSAMELVAELTKFRLEAQERFETLLPDQPTWEDIATEAGPDACLVRACLHSAACSPRSDLSAVELSARLGELGIRPRGPAKVRAALKTQGCDLRR